MENIMGVAKGGRGCNRYPFPFVTKMQIFILSIYHDSIFQIATYYTYYKCWKWLINVSKIYRICTIRCQGRGFHMINCQNRPLRGVPSYQNSNWNCVIVVMVYLQNISWAAVICLCAIFMFHIWRPFLWVSENVFNITISISKIQFINQCFCWIKCKFYSVVFEYHPLIMIDRSVNVVTDFWIHVYGYSESLGCSVLLQ